MSEVHAKITPRHLERSAVVYLRQSTEKQVRHNTESRRLQYALADRARDLGFRKVEVIDSDLGVSAAAGGRRREGFERLLTQVAIGEVGIVFSREVSRLSRTDKDWCRLMEVCHLFDTLIGDDQQVYDLSLTDDQLILGIKGTLSVVELRILRMRMHAGTEAKARRGELVRLLPPGYVHDELGRIVKDPDERVAQAMKSVFETFGRIGSVRQTFLWYRSEQVKLPVNKSRGGRMRLVWQLPTLVFIKSVLQNPVYAGAYVWGRRPTETVLVEGQLRKRQGAPQRAEECRVLIKDHHEGYIDWTRYEEIQRMIGANNTRGAGADEAVGPVREGQGLLAGLLRCGRCGRKLHVRYWGRSGTSARYLCRGTYGSGGAYCLAFGGTGVDRRFSEELLKVLSPLGVRASVEALQRLEAGRQEKRSVLTRDLQQLEWEAQKAFEQYDQVDARNRLVAGELERRWNESLLAVDEIKSALRELDGERPALSEEERNRILAMGERFGEVWNSPHCPAPVKKRIIRAVVEEIIADWDESEKLLSFTIRWRGGCHTAYQMARPVGGPEQKTDLEDLEIIRRMALRYGDGEIARVLNVAGRRTGKGNRWNESRVASTRKRYHIEGRRRTIRDPEILTKAQAARHCQVSTTTIHRLVEAGVLEMHQVVPWASWEIKRSDLDCEQVRSIIARLKRTGKLMIEGDDLSGQKSLFPTP
jgi:DNA invertase Pin-like site-specific DNA recombinase